MVGLHSLALTPHMTAVRIALANIRPATTAAQSVALAEQAIAHAAAAGAALVCFPECYIPGYRTPGKALPPPDQAWLDEVWRTIAAAAACARITVVLGTERLVAGEALPRITALVLDPDGATASFQDKVQLDPSEEGTYSSGTERRVFHAGPLTFGVAICHEGWRYPETVRWAARRGAQVVFQPHYHEPEPGGFRPTAFGDPRNTFHEQAMRCRAAENTIYFASVNCAIAGCPTTSAIIDPDGSVLAWQPYGEEGVLVADIELDRAAGLLAQRYKPV